MSIQSEITKVQNTKTNLRTAIMEKGVVVPPDDLFSTYPTRISQISAESGTYDESLKKLLDGSYTSYAIPDGTERLHSTAFESYTNLTQVTIPDTVTSIGRYAFKDCTGLTTLNIGRGVKTIGWYAFDGCSNIKNVNIKDIVAWCGVTLNTSGNSVKECPLSTASNLYIDGVLQTELNIPSPCTAINDRVFFGFNGEMPVVISDTVETIGVGAFNYCYHLTSVTIGTGIKSIGNVAFSNCYGLSFIICRATVPPTIGSSTFNSTGKCPIYVPAASVDAYKAAWTDYATRIMVIPHFERVNSLSDVTSGQYILVNEATGDVLNPKLISSTTSSSNGINANTNTVNVTINNGVIDFNDKTYNLLFDYDSAKGNLSKKVGSTTYYLRPGVSYNNYQEYFNYVNKKIEYEETEVEPYEINGDFTFLFTSTNKALRVRTANPSQIRWLSTSGSSYANVALYKLVE